MQSFGGVVFFNIDGLLSDDLAAVGDLVDKVDRGSGDLDTVIQCCLMDPQSVEAFTAEAGDQGGMDIDDPLGISGGEVFGQNGHEACQHDQIDAVCAQHFLELFFKGSLRAAFLFQHHSGVDAGFFGALQRISAGIVGNHQCDFAAFQSLALGIDQRLQVGAASGDQNSDVSHSKITFSSWAMMEPIT